MVSEEELKRKKHSSIKEIVKDVARKGIRPKITAKSKFISGYEASRLSKRPFTDWRNEPIRCERCGQNRKFREFRRNEDICIYCME